MIAPVGDADFDVEVLRPGVPVTVYFWATWCPPCRQVAPVLEELAQEYAGRLEIRKLDIDANPVQTAAWRVTGAPTFHTFRDGELVHSLTGARSKSGMRAALDDALAQAG